MKIKNNRQYYKKLKYTGMAIYKIWSCIFLMLTAVGIFTLTSLILGENSGLLVLALAPKIELITPYFLLAILLDMLRGLASKLLEKKIIFPLFFTSALLLIVLFFITALIFISGLFISINYLSTVSLPTEIVSMAKYGRNIAIGLIACCFVADLYKISKQKKGEGK